MKRLALCFVFASMLPLFSGWSADASNGLGSTAAKDPLADCPRGVMGAGGSNYSATQVEPWLASNPARPGNLVAVFQQDRWSDGGARGLVAAYSFDDGQSWKQTPLPFSGCTASFYRSAMPRTEATTTFVAGQRASDPWVSFGSDGIAYALGLTFDPKSGNNGMAAATSTDGGRTWDNLNQLILDRSNDPAEPFNDKGSVTADPVHPKTAYAVWDRLGIVPCPSDDLRPPHLKRGEANPSTDEPPCGKGPTYFTRTIDGGAHWEKPRAIVNPLINGQTLGNQIVVDPSTGRLYDFYDHIFPVGNDNQRVQLEVISSSDRGTTWSNPQVITKVESNGVFDPDNGAPLRTGGVIPEPAVDPANGQLYVVWQEADARSGEDSVMMSTSLGGGAEGSWTKPVEVNATDELAAFTPSIAVNRLGQLAIDYYAIRGSGGSGARLEGARYRRVSDSAPVVSVRPGRTPLATVTFGPEADLSGSFDLLAAPFAGGFFLGDYEGLTRAADSVSFRSIFARTQCSPQPCPPVSQPNSRVTVSLSAS